MFNVGHLEREMRTLKEVALVIINPLLDPWIYLDNLLGVPTSWRTGNFFGAPPGVGIAGLTEHCDLVIRTDRMNWETVKCRFGRPSCGGIL